MSEYMTKSEPVDKKPYIVYTDEKGILYSGDPDSDIPGGGGDTEYNITCYHFDGEGLTPIDSIIHSAVWNLETSRWKAAGGAVTKAKPGDVLMPEGITYGQILEVAASLEEDAMYYPYIDSNHGDAIIVMPAHNICVIFGVEG